MDTQVFSEKPANSNEAWEVAIIGSGPAGLTAGIYTTRGAASTLILGGENWGGQLMITSVVDNFPGFPEGILGPELISRMKNQVVRFGAEFVAANVTSIDCSNKPYKITAGDKVYLAHSVIIATGALTKWLEVPGEKELIGKGVSSCAPCDAPFFKDKKVAVVGGGDAAMEEAVVLTKYASEVTIIHRRDEFRASAAMQMKVKSNPKIKILWNTEVKELIGTQKLEKVKLSNTNDQTESELLVEGIFVAIGHMPDSGVFKGKIELDDKGYVNVTEHTKTNVPGIFVAGDVHDNLYKQAITAAGFGCMAGQDTLKYLESENLSVEPG